MARGRADQGLQSQPHGATVKFDVTLDAVIHIHLHDDQVSQRLDHIVTLINKLGASFMATSKELIAVANVAAKGITDLAESINTLEAAVTAALAKLPTIPADVQADIDAAFATLQQAGVDAAAAVADAADGIDEAAIVPPVVPA